MLPVIVAIGFMLTGPLGSDIIAEPQNVPDNALLPDVTPGVPKHLNIHNQQQNESLRFTNVWANIGPGTLEYEPLFPDPNANEGETQDAFQNLYDDEGNFGLTDQNIWHQTVSEFIFHETHNHWHINDIGEFSVRVDNNGVPGDIAVGDNGETASIKVGFWITNVFKYNGD